MFKQTLEVLKNKNRIERALKARRNSEIMSLRMKTAFKSRLYSELRVIDSILEDVDVEAVLVTVNDKMLSLFSTAIYSEDLVGYEVRQVEGESNVFSIRREFIDF